MLMNFPGKCYPFWVRRSDNHPRVQSRLNQTIDEASAFIQNPWRLRSQSPDMPIIIMRGSLGFPRDPTLQEPRHHIPLPTPGITASSNSPTHCSLASASLTGVTFGPSFTRDGVGCPFLARDRHKRISHMILCRDAELQYHQKVNNDLGLYPAKNGLSKCKQLGKMLYILAASAPAFT